MRHAFRQRLTEEEEESVFVSMTDMTVSFLFIVMILLAFFATQIAPGETVPKHELEEAERIVNERDLKISRLLEELSIFRTGDLDVIPQLQEKIAWLEERNRFLKSERDRLLRRLEEEPDVNLIEIYNTRANQQRARILDELEGKIKAAGIEVAISRERDALQFKGDGLFNSGSSTPTKQGLEKMRRISGILEEVVGCFSFGLHTTLAMDCNEHAALIDALQIEGHADSDGGDASNLKLSAERGAAISNVMARANPRLLEFLNISEQPIMSVAGYGEGRPIADESVPGGKDANRRIDIRFIMFSPVDEASVPASIDDLERIRDVLRGGPLE
ncbi:OmpA family protein [uncultured Ruegeria sp.]|uniref:OmpA/MotB family protein n=1 Tax=uncultured Ruegeria sp. TaxID=259304 RepID=UPI002608178F|nr:OmpA family protein [uncultured Ruegeria sp.]